MQVQVKDNLYLNEDTTDTQVGEHRYIIEQPGSGFKIGPFTFEGAVEYCHENGIPIESIEEKEKVNGYDSGKTD